MSNNRRPYSMGKQLIAALPNGMLFEFGFSELALLSIYHAAGKQTCDQFRDPRRFFRFIVVW